MNCEYCKKDFSCMSSFYRHIRTTKKCIAIREEIRLNKN